MEPPVAGTVEYSGHRLPAPTVLDDLQALARQMAAEVAELDVPRIDSLERAMLSGPPVHLPVVHRFTPGLYAREIFMPAGTLLTSKIHNTEHPYLVLSGVARVYIPGRGVVEVKAGHVGVTYPGTRRVLYILEDCRWITFHPLTDTEEEQRLAEATEDEMLVLIEERIIEPHLHLDGADVHREYLAALEAFRLTPGAAELAVAP